MALPKDPTAPEFFVYVLEVSSVAFYVGIGRAARASDRVRYVKYLLRREAQGKSVKWGLSAAVIARLLQRGHDVKVVYRRTGMVRADALAQERLEIARLLESGHVLANVQHNPRRPKQPDDILDPLFALLAHGQGGE